MSYTATVTRTISAAHHNGPEGNKCQRNHGHDFKITVAFLYNKRQLDEYGWGPDFGAIKKVLDQFDHMDLNTMAPFSLGTPPSTENLCVEIVRRLEEEVKFQVGWISIDEGNNNNIRWYRDDS